ncbi:hypothetical protein EDC17_100725 [Sphingobacterium alimentarium]|uniref:Uncharacterized protein n=1 Tax=Sphingobacterium alimentarium TaxID=797292 RepID=A0A4R3VV71_9SPHI|nr:hypothetical protein EDC17_100725 [Sphingobacterium alimentarium]
MSGPDDERMFLLFVSDAQYKGLVINSFGAYFSYRASKQVIFIYKKSRQESINGFFFKNM